VLRHESDDKQTLGVLIAPGPASVPELFVCKTLERPWKDNANDISCIPEGTYVCRWSVSAHLSELAGHTVETYEILDVPGRTGIRIHSANQYKQLLGCIALGDAAKDIDADGELDMIHSGDTARKFNDLFCDGNGAHEDFQLRIKMITSE
jgi:hypothetical protein